MADETAVIKIQYDTDEAVKKINDLSDAIANNNARQDELKKMLKDGKISQKDYAVQMAETSQTLARDGFERKKYINIVQSEIGSIKRAKAENQMMREERNKLNLQTEEGRKKLEEYNKKIDANTAIIKGNVDQQSKLYMSLGKLGDSMKNIPGPIGGIISGIVGMTKASLAFIATPIGMVIAAIGLALGALMKYFKGSEEGQNRLNKIMSVFKVIAGNVGDLIQKVGKWIMDAVSKPRETIEKLGNLIKENLINRFQAFGVMGKAIIKIFKGDFKEGFKDLANGAIQMTTGVENAIDKVGEFANKAKDAIKGVISETEKEIKTAQQLADRQAALDLLQRKFLVGRAKLEKEIAELREQAADKANMSDEERIKLLTEAMKKEDEILATNLKITQEKANLKKIQNSLSNSTKEDLNEQAQLEADVFAVQKENAMKKKEMTAQIAEIQNRLNAATKEQGEASTEANEEDQKAQEEILKRRGEAIAKLAELKQKELEENAKGFQELRDLQIEQAEAEKKRKLEEQGLLNEEIELIEAEHKARLAEINQAYEEQIRAQHAETLAQAQESMQAIIDATQGMADSRVTILGSAFAKISTINWKEVKTAGDAFIAIGNAAKGLTDLLVKNYDQDFANLAAQKEAELALVGDNKEAQDAINKKYAKEELKLKKKAFEEDKKKALIDAAIATALAVVKGLASGLPMPGILMAALAAVLGGVQIAAIAKQTYTPTYAKGGIIGGRSHAEGGTKFWGSDGSMFEAEKGEAMFVMKKDATSEIAALSAINESHGGRSFFEKSPARTYADGGEVSAPNVNKIVDEAISRTPIYVKVGDIETGLTETAKVKQAGII